MVSVSDSSMARSSNISLSSRSLQSFLKRSIVPESDALSFKTDFVSSGLSQKPLLAIRFSISWSLFSFSERSKIALQLFQLETEILDALMKF